MTTLVTYTTPTHSEMCQRFVLDRAAIAGFADNEVILIEDRQICPTGGYKSEGYNDQTASKISSLARLPVGERYLFVDADCCLFSGLHRWTHTKETDRLYLADDVVQACTGVMLWTHTEQTQALFQLTADLVTLLDFHDQEIINWLHAVALPGRFPVRVQKISKFIAVNWACLSEKLEAWNGQQIVLPKTTKVFHANYCIGVENKTRLLESALEAHEGLCHRT